MSAPDHASHGGAADHAHGGHDHHDHKPGFVVRWLFAPTTRTSARCT